jgi:hypothetical protein
MGASLRIDQGAKALQVGRSGMSDHNGSTWADDSSQFPGSNRAEYIEGHVDGSVRQGQASSACHRIPSGGMRASSRSHCRLCDIDTEHRRRGNNPGVMSLTATHIEHDARLLACGGLGDGSRQRVISTRGQEPTPGIHHLGTVTRLTATALTSEQEIDIALTCDIKAVACIACPLATALAQSQALPADRTAPEGTLHAHLVPSHELMIPAAWRRPAEGPAHSDLALGARGHAPVPRVSPLLDAVLARSPGHWYGACQGTSRAHDVVRPREPMRIDKTSFPRSECRRTTAAGDREPVATSSGNGRTPGRNSWSPFPPDGRGPYSLSDRGTGAPAS